MTGKTHQTAVVLIPPEDVWEPIQAIRRKYDRHVRRWMPHVTMLYPFVHRTYFDAAETDLREACSKVEPFDLRLDEFRHFDHGRERYTLWLAPEPQEPVLRLQKALESAVPNCNDVSRRPEGFTPHLSVGQVRGCDRMASLKAKLQAAWSAEGGLSFSVRHAKLIWRNSPPDDIFRVDRLIFFGS